MDDAVHILRLDGGTTFCGQPIYRVGTAVAFDAPRPDGAGGCWMCLQKSEQVSAYLMNRFDEDDR